MSLGTARGRVPLSPMLRMQLAFHLGFSEVVLIGVDHSFADKGPANKLVTASGADANHFDPNYFGVGVKWQLPDLEVSEAAYRLARDAFRRAGDRSSTPPLGESSRSFRRSRSTSRASGPAG